MISATLKTGELEDMAFERFTLTDIPPKAATEGKRVGDIYSNDAAGHAGKRMVNQVYGRRTIKHSKVTKQDW